MRIEHIGKSTVKVTVSGSELERLGLRYEDLGENILSDIFLSEMIEKACPELKNRTPPEGELSIEVFPAKDTGCVFYISPKKRRSSENHRRRDKGAFRHLPKSYPNGRDVGKFPAHRGKTLPAARGRYPQKRSTARGQRHPRRRYLTCLHKRARQSYHSP